MDRATLKLECLERLDALAIEHPAGHQGKLAARYLLRCSNGDRAEVMFEKGPKTPANLWVAHKRVVGLISEPGLEYRLSPASGLCATKGANGKPIYGRHSALKPMRELGHTDLACFRVNSVSELGRILDHLQERA